MRLRGKVLTAIKTKIQQRLAFNLDFLARRADEKLAGSERIPNGSREISNS
jgi:hypothetical protein